MAPVSKRRVLIAAEHLEFAEEAALACREAGLPYYVACALLEQEGGRNIYGHDPGGVFTIKGTKKVTAKNFMQFFLRVINGEQSNGVGPCQITYAGVRRSVVGGGHHRDGGHFAVMIKRGLLPWLPRDNMTYGFGLLAADHRKGESWRRTYARYNGGNDPSKEAWEHADRFGAIVTKWKTRLGV